MRENRLLRVIFNSDLRCSHDGLKEIAKQVKVDVDSLEPGEFVAFINSKQTMLKLYAAGQTVAHVKPGGRINLKVLAVIPKYFNGSEIKYNEALKETILKELK